MLVACFCIEQGSLAKSAEGIYIEIGQEVDFCGGSFIPRWRILVGVEELAHLVGRGGFLAASPLALVDGAAHRVGLLGTLGHIEHPDEPLADTHGVYGYAYGGE